MSSLSYAVHRISVDNDTQDLFPVANDWIFRIDASRPRRFGLDSSDRAAILLSEPGAAGSGADYLSQGTAGSRATMGVRDIGGIDVLDFDGGDTYGLTILTPTRPCTILAVVHHDSFAGDNKFVISGSNNGVGMYFTTTTGLLSYNQANTVAVNSAFAVGTSDPAVVGFAVSASNVKFVFNASREDGANSTAATATTGLVGGFTGGGGLFNGGMGELVIWDYELSVGDLASVVNHLMSKWGIS